MTETTMIRAAVVPEAGADYEMREIELDAPQAHEVRVRIVGCGICQSDTSVQHQKMPTPLPMVLGHEGSGIVEAVGDQVTKVGTGDRVVLTMHSCGSCRMCLSGEPMYCLQMYRLNFQGERIDGTNAVCSGPAHVHFFGQSSFATHALGHERNVVKIDNSDVDIALLGPLGCGMQTGAGAVLNALKVRPGSSVAVFGCGGVGLAAVMAARLSGVSRLIAVDVVPERLELARELGATDTIRADEGDSFKAVRKLTGGGADYTVETSGISTVLEQAIRATGYRGSCAVVGMPAVGTTASFDVNLVLSRGITIRGVVEGDSVPDLFIPQLVEHFAAGRFPFDRLVQTYGFDEINQAVSDMQSGKTIKPIIRIGDN